MRSDEDERSAEEERGPLDLPDEHEPADDLDKAHQHRSLSDDLLALLDDGRTYAEAEVRFQRSRIAFTAERAKGAALYGFAAFGVLHLALIALTVGVVIALAPLVGAWAATAIVAAVLVVIGLFLLRKLKGRLDQIFRAFSGKDL